MKKRSQWKWYLSVILAALILTLLDQAAKYQAVLRLKGQESVSLIDGVLELRYLENRGMAFGLLQGKVPFFLIVCVLFFAGILYVLIRLPRQRKYLPLAVVLPVLFAGAMGNFIDRACRGYVVDFIYVSLIDFPTFNFADMYVVCGGIVLVLLLCFKYRDEEFDFLK